MTMGVELELQLIDWRTFNLCPAAPRVFAALGGETPRVKAEIFQSMVEINTGVCTTVGDVRRDLEQAIAELRGACQAVGVELASAGSHPFANHRDRLAFPANRYTHLIERNKWIARRLAIFGLHVHVGMRSGDHCITMINAISPYLGHLLALSASSPYWEAEDTDLASARVTIFEASPTAGTPPSFEDWRAFEGFFDRMITTRSITSIKDFWWDVRPSPGFGTLEVRICDGPATISETVAIVALLRCLLAKLDEDAVNGRRFEPTPTWMMRENKWRAARYGLEADIVDVDGHSRPLRGELARLLQELAPTSRRLGCAKELESVGRILEGGGSSARQRAEYARSQSHAAVAAALINEFQDDLSAPLGDGVTP